MLTAAVESSLLSGRHLTALTELVANRSGSAETFQV
jgi:hypothetical protein